MRVGWQGEELELQEVYRRAKDRATKRVGFQIFRKLDMGVLRGRETCWGRDVATAVVNLECHVVKMQQRQVCGTGAEAQNRGPVDGGGS